jgi:hypothetical protein
MTLTLTLTLTMRMSVSIRFSELRLIHRSKQKKIKSTIRSYLKAVNLSVHI